MINVANAPCSWGVLEFGMEGKTAGFSQVLDEMTETGYEGTELGDWGFMPTEPGLLRTELNRRDLALVGAFVPVAFSDPSAHSKGLETALSTARLMASAGFPDAFLVLSDNNGTVAKRTLNAGRISPRMGLSKGGWRTFGQGVDMVARRVLEETGIRIAFHHHCAGYVETPEEIERLLDVTDPDLVALVFDTGHLSLGGGDPDEHLRKWSEWILHVHLKDCDNGTATRAREEGWDYFDSVRAGIFCELGKGRVDFPAVVEKLRNLDYSGWVVVEQDVLPGMGTPKECARRNRDYLATLGI